MSVTPIADNNGRICVKCNSYKEWSEFSNLKGGFNRKNSSCKNCDLKRVMDYYWKNREREILRNRKYKKENRSKINKTRRRYEKNKLKNDKKYRLYNKIRLRIHSGILNKSKRTMEYVGCSIDFLVDYLNEVSEINFNEYIDGRGNYHLDHIIPIKFFDLSKEEEVEKCWNYKNLRIITKDENLSRKVKIDFNLIEKYNIFNLLPKEVL